MSIAEGDAPAMGLKPELAAPSETLVVNPDQHQFHRAFVSAEIWGEVDALILEKTPLDVAEQLEMRKKFTNIFSYVVAEALFSQFDAEVQLELAKLLAEKPTDHQVNDWLKKHDANLEQVDNALNQAMLELKQLLSGQKTLKDLS
jgi:hypothetical protein